MFFYRKCDEKNSVLCINGGVLLLCVWRSSYYGNANYTRMPEAGFWGGGGPVFRCLALIYADVMFCRGGVESINGGYSSSAPFFLCSCSHLAASLRASRKSRTDAAAYLELHALGIPSGIPPGTFSMIVSGTYGGAAGPWHAMIIAKKERSVSSCPLCVSMAEPIAFRGL